MSPTGVYEHYVRVPHAYVSRGKQTPEYRAYHHAKDRCNNSKDKGYPYYGGRGIEFRFKSFEEFITHIGLKPNPRLSLDRIKNDGHYEIGNVQWATRSQQTKNRRSNGRQGKHYKTRCIEGHELTKDNLVPALARKGIHRCRTCVNAYSVAYRKARNEE
jgi:hypothetical protein